MKIVIAPDSFKGSLTALEVAQAIKRGIEKVDSNTEFCIVPMADGGEGTVQSLVDATGGQIIEHTVHDPLFRKINSFYGILGDGKTAVIEMAAASGLPLLTSKERNPLIATTYGTGELIKHALDKGCRNFIIGLGGSATNDGGSGMAMALGTRFLTKDGKDIDFGGGALSDIASIDNSALDERIKSSTFIAACDVENPLCGEQGASAVYGPQKGATSSDVTALDKNLNHFANIIKAQLNIDIKDIPGAGAAGGLGAGVLVFLNATLDKGINIITQATNLLEKTTDADLVITGEGRIDYQTAFGKTPFGVAQIAKQNNIPVIAIAGSLGEKYQTLCSKGFDEIYAIKTDDMELEYAIQNANTLLEEKVTHIFKEWITEKKLKYKRMNMMNN